MTKAHIQALTKDQAIKMSELGSELFPQGGKWVFRSLDFDSGVYRLKRFEDRTRAERYYLRWRRECVEELMRAAADTPAFLIRTWYPLSHAAAGDGVWQPLRPHWFASRDDAECAQAAMTDQLQGPWEVVQVALCEVPPSFTVWLAGCELEHESGCAPVSI